MKIEAKDSLEIYGLLSDNVHSNSWLTIPRNKLSLAPGDLAVFDTYKNAAGSIKDTPEKEVFLLFPLFVAMGTDMQVSYGKKGGRFLPTELNLDFKTLTESSRIEIEEQRKVEVMLEQLAPYGFGKELLFDLRFELQFKEPAFSVNSMEKQGSQKITYKLGFNSDLTGDPSFIGYTATLREPLPVIKGNFGVVNIGMLDKRMAKVDWENELVDNKKRPEDPFIFDNKEVPGILKSLALLEAHSMQAMEMAGLLKFKYWEGTPNESLIPMLKAYRLEFNKSITVKRDEHPLFTKTMAANLLSGRPVGIHDSEGGTIWYLLKDSRFRLFKETGDVMLHTLAKMPLIFNGGEQPVQILDKLRNGDDVDVLYKGSIEQQPARLQIDLPQGIRAIIKGTKGEILSNLIGPVQDLNKEKVEKALDATPPEQAINVHSSKTQKR